MHNKTVLDASGISDANPKVRNCIGNSLRFPRACVDYLVPTEHHSRSAFGPSVKKQKKDEASKQCIQNGGQFDVREVIEERVIGSSVECAYVRECMAQRKTTKPQALILELFSTRLKF